MKGIVIERAGELRAREVPAGTMSDYRARVHVVSGSICNSTDRKLLEGTFPGCTEFPAVLGHEAVGEVVEVGSRVRNYETGDLVIRPRMYYGAGTAMREYFGSFAEEAFVTDQWAIDEDDPPETPAKFGHPQQVVPPGFSAEAGVLSITLKETLSWIRRFGIGEGQRVVVFGTGPVGVAFSLFSRALGASQVVLVGRTAPSIERAAELCSPDAALNVSEGNVSERIVEITSGGADRVVEGVGDTAIIDQGIACLAEGGEVGIYGVPPTTQEKAKHAADPRVKYIDPDESEVHEEFFEMVSRGQIDPQAFASHTVHFDRTGEGFDLLGRREAFKVLLHW